MPRTFQSRRIPGPFTERWWGHLAAFREDPLGLLLRGFHEYGDICQFRFGLLPSFLLAGPEQVRSVFTDTTGSFSKRIPAYETLYPLFGRGVLTSEGDLWRRQRLRIQPAFKHQSIDALAPLIENAAEAVSARWQATAGEVLSIHLEMVRFTLRVIGKGLFEKDLSDQARRVASAVDIFWQTFPESSFLPVSNGLLSRSRHASLDESIRDLNQIVDLLVRAQSTSKTKSLLSRLISPRGEIPDSQRMRQEIMTILIGGYETTASALTYALYALVRYPNAAQRLRSELDAVLGGRAPVLEDLPRLPFLKQFIDEVLRLYPPAWILARRVARDFEIDGYVLPRGAIVLLSPFVTHRHPEFWDRSECFDPDRFSAQRSQSRHRGAYFPFAAGPRACPGSRLAMLEIQILIATLAQRFELRFVPGSPFEVTASVTLHPIQGPYMRVQNRSARAHFSNKKSSITIASRALV